MREKYRGNVIRIRKLAMRKGRKVKKERTRKRNCSKKIRKNNVIS